MLVIRVLLGVIGFGGLLIWPGLCILVSAFPEFHVGEPGPGLSRFERSLYVIAPLLAFAYYAIVSVATPRRIVAVIGVALHLSLITVIVAAMRYPDAALIVALTVGGVASFLLSAPKRWRNTDDVAADYYG